MRSIIGAALLTLATLCAPLATTMVGAAEDRHSANFWLPRCKGFIGSGTLGVDEAFCGGEVWGLAYASCASLPVGVTPEQVMRVVVRYIEARPQRMHEPFLPLAWDAVIDAWPCKP
jgi:hypothetical protein